MFLHKEKAVAFSAMVRKVQHVLLKGGVGIMNVAVRFNVGGLVRLRSGGPVMTVELHELPTGLDRKIKCVWFAGGKLKRDYFDEESVVPATEAEL